MRLVATTAWVDEVQTEGPERASPARLFAVTRRLLGSLEGPEDAPTARPIRLVVNNTTRSP